MTNEEAKFVLSAYRPNGADARDAGLAEALEQAKRDEALRTWFERSQALDRVVAEKLRAVQPPADLRASLLAGARVSQTSTAWWQRSAWLGVAAAVTVMLAVTAVMWRQASRGAAVSSESIREVARADLSGAHPRAAHASDLGGLRAWLEDPANRLAAGLPVDENQLRDGRCREIAIGGQPVFEICFKRGEGWFHVYIAPRDGINDRQLDDTPRFEEAGALAMATWADAAHVYVLATSAGMNALKGAL